MQLISSPAEEKETKLDGVALLVIDLPHADSSPFQKPSPDFALRYFEPMVHCQLSFWLDIYWVYISSQVTDS